MRKVISATLLGSMLVLGSVNASQISNQINSVAVSSEVKTINENDAKFLFNNIETSKVAVLDSTEMNETKGQFWAAFSGIIAGLGFILDLGKTFKWW